jgi:hypothetical protein
MNGSHSFAPGSIPGWRKFLFCTTMLSIHYYSTSWFMHPSLLTYLFPAFCLFFVLQKGYLPYFSTCIVKPLQLRIVYQWAWGCESYLREPLLPPVFSPIPANPMNPSGNQSELRHHSYRHIQIFYLVACAFARTSSAKCGSSYFAGK